MARRNRYFGGLIGASPVVPYDEHWGDVTLLLDGTSVTSDAAGQSTVSIYNPAGATVTANQSPGAKWPNTYYIDIPNNGHINVTLPSGLGRNDTAFTVEAWVYFDAISDDGVFQLLPNGLLSSTGVGAGDSLAMSVVGSSWKLYKGVVGATTTGSVGTGQYYHIALTSDGTTLRWFVDGSLLDSATVASANIPAAGFPYMAVGGFFNLSYPMDGRVQDVRVTDGVARYTSDFTPPTASFLTTASPIRPGVSNLGSLSGEGASTTKPTRRWGGITGRSITTDVDEAPVIDNSLRFDGTNDYLNRVVTASNRTTWTWSAWVKRDDLSRREYLFSGGANADDSNLFYLQWERNHTGGNNQLGVVWREATPDYTRSMYTTASYNDTSAWYHVVLSVDTTQSAASDKMKLYVDGTEITSFLTDQRNTIGTNDPLSVNAAGNMCMGAYAYNLSDTAARFKGLMAEVHFIDGTAYDASYFGETRDGVWLPKEVTGLTYGNNGFYLDFAGNDTGVTLLLDGSSTTNDASSANIASNLVADANITATNTSSLSISAPYGAGPVNVLDFPSNQTTGISHTSSSIPELLDPTETQWTIELWVRPESIATYDYLIAQASDGATGWSNGLEWILDWDTSNIYFVGHNGSGGNTSLLQASLSTYGITVNNWHHIAVVRDGSDTMLFLNGQKAATITNQNIVRTAGNRNLFIGTDPTDNYAFHGQMADIRITKGIARYTGSFTPPTSALSADVSGITGSDDVTLLLNGSSLTDQSSASSGTATENGYASAGGSMITVTGPYGSSDSVYTFDGSDDYLNLGNVDALGLTDGDWTIECWVYPQELDDYQVIASYGGDDPSWDDPYGQEWVLMYGASAAYFQFKDASNFTNVTANHNMALNKWYHIAATRNNNSIQLFINGNQIASSTTTPTTISNPNKLVIGATPSFGAKFEGYIDDIRITKGAALYPFHPPISTLTNTPEYLGDFGVDRATNSNDFSVEGNITPDDQLLDTPNLRFATLDASDLSDANLTTRNLGTNTGVRADSYGQKSSGKWYWETSLVDTSPSGNHTGVWDISETMGTNYVGQTSGSWGLYLGIGGTAPRVRHNGTYTTPSGVTAFASGDIISIAIDLDSGKMWYAKNGVWFESGNPSAGTGDAYPTNPLTGTLAPADIQRDTMTYNFGQDHTFAGAKSPLLTPYSDTNGVGEFYYEPPSGFLALTTKVVASETILPTTGRVTLLEHYQSKL